MEVWVFVFVFFFWLRTSYGSCIVVSMLVLAPSFATRFYFGTLCGKGVVFLFLFFLLRTSHWSCMGKYHKWSMDFCLIPQSLPQFIIVPKSHLKFLIRSIMMQNINNTHTQNYVVLTLSPKNPLGYFFYSRIQTPIQHNAKH